MKPNSKSSTSSCFRLCLTTTCVLFASASVSEGQTKGANAVPAAPQSAEGSKGGQTETAEKTSAKLNATASQSDGKILIAGLFTKGGEAIHRNLARLNTDGTMDHTFTANTDGEVKTVSVQADDEILISGSFTKINDTEVAVSFGGSTIARLDRNGNLVTVRKAVPESSVNGSVPQVRYQPLINGRQVMPQPLLNNEGRGYTTQNSVVQPASQWQQVSSQAQPMPSLGQSMAQRLQPMMQGVPQQMVQGVPQQMMQVVPQQMGQVVPQQMMQGVPQQMVQGVPQQMVQGVPQQMVQGVPQQMVQGVPQQMVQGVPQQMVQGVPQQMVQGVPQQMVQGVPQQMVQGVPQQMVQGVQQQMVQGVPQQMVQGVPQQMVQGVPQQMVQGVPQQIVQGVPQPMVQAVPVQVVQPMPQGGTQK